MILLQVRTQEYLDQALAESPHALLISGPLGAGKAYTAKHFAWQRLGLESPEKLDSYPYFSTLTPESNTISIEQIRQLQDKLRLKTPGDKLIRRIVIIEDAHRMTTEAQNALLKSLEEPPADTILILTAPQTQAIKATIYSRVQQLPVLPITQEQARAFFVPQFSQAEVDKAYLMSGGLPGLLSALLNQTDHPMLAQVQHAKQLLGSTLYARLLAVDGLSKQKDELPLFLQTCKLICSTALNQAIVKADAQKTTHWHKALEAVHQAQAALPRNPNPKLLLDNLFLTI